mgnify:CR=1 FL=1
MVVNGYLMSNKFKIVVTGGSGRFGSLLKQNVGKNYFFPKKKKLNILNLNSTINYLSKIKPRYLVHLAGLSRPLKLHDKNIEQSIKLNIIGTSNVTIACKKLNIKLIHFSTSYVYPGKKGNYKEEEPLLPINSYAWSKLGGECSVRLYKNSLIVRASMTEKPFVHKSAFSDFLTNFIFHDEIAPVVFKILNLKGIINFGGKSQSVFKFVKKYNPKIKKISYKKIFGNSYPSNTTMNMTKFKKFLKKDKKI